jgi:hypothetical protein
MLPLLQQSQQIAQWTISFLMDISGSTDGNQSHRSEHHGG